MNLQGGVTSAGEIKYLPLSTNNRIQNLERVLFPNRGNYPNNSPVIIKKGHSNL